MRVPKFILFIGWISGFCDSGKNWQNSPLTISSGQVVEVSPEHNASRIRMEIRNSENGNWELVNTGYLPKSSTGKLYFKIPQDVRRSQLRFRSNDISPISFSSLQGRSIFSARKGNESNMNMMRTMMTEDTQMSLSSDMSSDEGTDNVQESNLWRIVGNQLFFFNQMRGLQVVDLSDPQNPLVEARYRLPASGEQMYILENGKYAVLICRPAHQEWPDYYSEIRILKISENIISEIKRIDLHGYYMESRIVGDRLYLVAQKWEKDKIVEEGWGFSYSTRLQSFDLTDPENPKELSERIIPGSAQVISANNSSLLVVTRDPGNYYHNHIVRVFDISQNQGIPELLTEIKPGGQVLDKFKLRIRNGVLTVISQAYRENNWSRYSLLENFDLSTGNLLGSIDLAERETLYATSFDGDYAYIVTFLRKDPLFIVDLRNPSTPVVLSELIVPGWSEYIQPLGDYLFAVGVEDRRVTASLFDVSNKEDPFLSDRIYLGDEDSYSWSEANYDEKAIGRFPELNTFLVPFETWEKNNYQNKVQILEVENSRLIERGKIEHSFQARRSALDDFGTKIFSISGNDLQVTDFVDRENPKPLSVSPLAWKVDQIQNHSEFLIQLEQAGEYYTDVNSSLRITSKTEPDDLISSLDLGAGKLAGSHLKGDILHIAMLERAKLRVLATKIFRDGTSKVMGQIEVPSQMDSYNCSMYFFQLNDNLICWASARENNSYFPYFRRSMMVDYFPYPYETSGQIELHLFSTNIQFDEIFFEHENNMSIPYKGNFIWSKPVMFGNQLLYGSQETIFYKDQRIDESGLTVVESMPQPEINSNLHRFDFSDPYHPKQNAPTSAPGLLAGSQTISTATDFSYLFFESKDSSIGIYRPILRSVEKEEFGRSLTSCLFDGINLYYLDEIEIEEDYLPISISENLIFTPQTESQGLGLQSMSVDENGLFQREGVWFENSKIYEFSTNGSSLLARGSKGMLYSNFTESNHENGWQETALSGDFYPKLDHFIETDNKFLIPSGNYGVEVISIERPIVEMTEISSHQDRRSSQTEVWKEIDEQALRVFNEDDVPVTFYSDKSAGWRFRQNSVFDLDVTETSSHWKNNKWFGGFYSRTYPWLYHVNLGWCYIHEIDHSSFWMWRNENGWVWSSSQYFPYTYSDPEQAWLYFDLANESPSTRYYNFGSAKWFN